MSSYILSNIAESDIEEITAYISINNVNSAIDFVDSLYSKFSLLADNPYMGHVRHDLTPNEGICNGLQT